MLQMFTVLLLQLLLVSGVMGWHDLDTSEYDCWPLEKPDELNMMECGGAVCPRLV